MVAALLGSEDTLITWEYTPGKRFQLTVHILTASPTMMSVTFWRTVPTRSVLPARSTEVLMAGQSISSSHSQV